METMGTTDITFLMDSLGSSDNLSEDGDNIENEPHLDKSDFNNDSSNSNSATSENGKGNNKQKCSFCSHRRERNDLCNRCRQKVESRARKLLEQKLIDDVIAIEKIAAVFQSLLNIFKVFDRNNNNHSIQWSTDICQLFIDIFPFLIIKCQSENTYGGTKGCMVWCIPKSILRSMCLKLFDRCDEKQQKIINDGKRNDLCELITDCIASKIKQHCQKHNVNETLVDVDAIIDIYNNSKSNDKLQNKKSESKQRNLDDSKKDTDKKRSMVASPLPLNVVDFEESLKNKNSQKPCEYRKIESIHEWSCEDIISYLLQSQGNEQRFLQDVIPRIRQHNLRGNDFFTSTQKDFENKLQIGSPTAFQMMTLRDTILSSTTMNGRKYDRIRNDNINNNGIAQINKFLPYALPGNSLQSEHNAKRNNYCNGIGNYRAVNNFYDGHNVFDSSGVSDCNLLEDSPFLYGASFSLPCNAPSPTMNITKWNNSILNSDPNMCTPDIVDINAANMPLTTTTPLFSCSPLNENFFNFENALQLSHSDIDGDTYCDTMAPSSNGSHCCFAKNGNMTNGEFQ